VPTTLYDSLKNNHTTRDKKMNSKELIIEEANRLHLELQQNLQTLKRLAINEAWGILQLVIASVVQIIESVGKDLSSPEKKQLALDIISNFYDNAFKVVDLPFVPGFIEPIIHRYVKAIIMIMVGSAIDATVTIFRQTGIFLRKGTL
jgi:hypothetical protein